MSRGVVSFEVPAADTQRARDFYGRLFGWTFEPFGSDEYHVASEASGAIHAAPGEHGLLTYFGVDDIDVAVTRVQELGGEAGPTQEIPGIGRYTHCSDSEGNRFALYEQDGAQ